MNNTAEYNMPSIDLLCGNKAYFDRDTGCSYRCIACFATVGSIGMPRSCKELYDMEEVVDKLKGRKNVDI